MLIIAPFLTPLPPFLDLRNLCTKQTKMVSMDLTRMSRTTTTLSPSHLCRLLALEVEDDLRGCHLAPENEHSRSSPHVHKRQGSVVEPHVAIAFHCGQQLVGVPVRHHRATVNRLALHYEVREALHLQTTRSKVFCFVVSPVRIQLSESRDPSLSSKHVDVDICNWQSCLNFVQLFKCVAPRVVMAGDVKQEASGKNVCN